MILARALSLLSLLATVAFLAQPANAAQRSERRGGGQRNAGAQEGGRQAQPRPPATGTARAADPDRGDRDVVVATRNGAVQGRGYRGPGVNTYPGPGYGRGGDSRYGSYPRYGYGYGGFRNRGGYRYSHPYYAFRPRSSVGIGFFAGFAVPFPSYGYGARYMYGAYPPYGYGVPYPVPYAAPYPVPYPVPYPSAGYGAQAPSHSIAAVPGAQAYGGVSVDITPGDAEVWVNGGYAGTADDFGPTARPLTLPVGLHRIEVRAPGYQSMVFDVTVTPGYVIPYQGVLQPQP